MKRYTPSLLTALVIIILSLYPFEEDALPDVPLADKWTHMVMYGGFSIILWIDHFRARLNGEVRWAKTLIITVVCPILLGGLMELAQAKLTTTRSGDWMDALANTIGVLTVLLLALSFLVIVRHKRCS